MLWDVLKSLIVLHLEDLTIKYQVSSESKVTLREDYKDNTW